MGYYAMKFREIFEGMVIGYSPERELRDTDVVRVYHGTDDLEFLGILFGYGMSGDVRASRRYSYESNNNPRGLFVSPDLRIAKDFGGYVIEFHARVSELEAPVWPDGMFTVQGGMSGIFRDGDSREAERLRQRMKWSKSDISYISDSDRPELAGVFFGIGERQALFTGALNSNSVRAIWMSDDTGRVGQRYSRLRPREFMKLLSRGEATLYGRRVDVGKTERTWKAEDRVVKPLDVISGEEFLGRLCLRYPSIIRSEIENIVGNDLSIVRQLVWTDKQYERIVGDLGLGDGG